MILSLEEYDNENTAKIRYNEKSMLARDNFHVDMKSGSREEVLTFSISGELNILPRD